MALSKAVVRLDKIASVYDGPLASIRHTSELQNGMVVGLGALHTGEREVFDVAVPVTAADLTGTVFVLHASPEVVYNEGLWFNNDGTIATPHQLGDFSVPANKVGRAFHLHVGDIFTIDDRLCDAATAVGNYLVPKVASLNLHVSTDMTSIDGGSNTTVPRLVLKVIAKETLGLGFRGQYGMLASAGLDIYKQDSTVVQVTKV